MLYTITSRTQKNWEVKKYRVKITGLSKDYLQEIIRWLEENNLGWSHNWNIQNTNNVDYFYFDCEEDVVAFKLMWE